MESERISRWAAHCHRMAEATYAIADWCEDTEMMGAYLALAARWVQIAAVGPPQGRPGSEASPPAAPAAFGSDDEAGRAPPPAT